jgi:hypothetical protein
MEWDLSRLPSGTLRKMDEIFRTDFNLKVLQAVADQTRTAKRLHQGVAWKDDIGPQYAEINPVIDSLWRHVYGHDYTEDADKMRFLGRRNPEILARARSGKIQIGYEPKAQTPNTKHQTPRGRMGCVFGRGTLKLAT